MDFLLLPPVGPNEESAGEDTGGKTKRGTFSQAPAAKTHHFAGRGDLSGCLPCPISTRSAAPGVTDLHGKGEQTSPLIHLPSI